MRYGESNSTSVDAILLPKSELLRTGEMSLGPQLIKPQHDVSAEVEQTMK